MTLEFENETIKSVLGGRTEAFETLVLEYQKPIYNLALRMTGSPEDAADMTQETFVKAYRALPSFHGDSRFSAWLYRIASNVCRDFLRSRRKKQAVSLTVADEDTGETELEIADMRHSPEQALEAALTRDAVRSGLLQLSPEQRQILIMREIAGLSYDEIGRALGLEQGTVKSRIFRARRRLCALLIDNGNIPDGISSVCSEGGAER